ncbi:hypothetical protein GCM10010528_11870 [Gordonia defluvii]|uniref:Uncharacterized protein n=1 Tax=Gordonia defluvii TaxID=283718 RepID=A0ABP6L471_9ACTN|nr:hypothetical protein [Gordonia sp. UBA5067]
MKRRWVRRHLATIILSVLFVVLLALYLYASSADSGEPGSGTHPTVTAAVLGRP